MAKGKKTGGRKPGSRNKRTVFLRDEFDRVGFDWGHEFMAAYSSDNFQKLAVLTELIPYLAAKLKEKELDDTPEPPQEDTSGIANDDITSQLKAVK